jgi:hypothetical protein
VADRLRREAINVCGHNNQDLGKIVLLCLPKDQPDIPLRPLPQTAKPTGRRGRRGARLPSDEEEEEGKGEDNASNSGAADDDGEEQDAGVPEQPEVGFFDVACAPSSTLF